MMDNKVIITYSLVGKKNALELTRSIYGYLDASNHGKYKYQRKGVLSNIPYEKISRGCLLLEQKYEKKVIRELLNLGLKPKVLVIKVIKRS